MGGGQEKFLPGFGPAWFVLLLFYAKIERKIQPGSGVPGRVHAPTPAGAAAKGEAKMLVVGEKINTSRKTVKEAVTALDAAFIRRLARQQAEGGAHYIDINCGTFIDREQELMTWLVEEVHKELDLPLCIDSPDPKAVLAGLKAHKKGQPMINSISGEKERYQAILPLVREYGAKIVVLTMDDEVGIPHDAPTRFSIARRVIDGLLAIGTREDDIYVDPLIQPISTDTANALSALDTIRMVKEAYPGTHAICGLSNVSFGLPERQLLNQTFMIMCMTAGLDGVILDPNDRRMMALIAAGEALLNKDSYCGRYLKAYRKGLLA
jgi:cobalamin-dependent methionine synthase I